MERKVGTTSRGIRAPIIRQGDDLAQIVVTSVLEAAESEGFALNDRDVVAVTESVVARAQGNYAGVDAIAARGAREGADVVLYGHTHVRHEAHYAAGDIVGGVKLEKALHVFNPGSLGSPRDEKAPSFGVIEIRENGILFSHGEV